MEKRKKKETWALSPGLQEDFSALRQLCLHSLLGWHWLDWGHWFFPTHTIWGVPAFGRCMLFSCQVVMILWPHGLQQARLPCPSPSPEVSPSSCPMNWWCHPTGSSSVTLFSFCLQYFLASGSFPMSWLFTSGGQKYNGPQIKTLSICWKQRTYSLKI